MSMVPRPLVTLIAGTACAVALLNGCSSTTGDPVASPSAPTVSSTSPSASASATTAGSPSIPADAVIINITVADKQVSPNGEKINVTKGQTVVLNVTSDADDEIHAHNSGDGYELEVKAGEPTTGQFVAADTGSFEVESHHLEKVIAILVVR